MKQLLRLFTSGEFLGKAALLTVFTVLAFMKAFSTKVHLDSLARTDRAENYIDLAADVASLGFLVLLLVLTLTRFRPRQTAEGWEPRVSALLGSFLSFSLVALPPAEFGPAWRVACVVLIALGSALSICVVARLGRSFSIVPQARQLVTKGPYAIVRHPLYLCEEIAILGVVLLHLSPAAIIIVVVQWLFQLRRMANEERLLGASFPEYAAYAARTPRVIPRLSRRWDAASSDRLPTAA